MSAVDADFDEASRITVLHVEDDPAFADLTATYLEREHEALEVTTATSADEGLALVTDQGVDCIVSDYDMPGLDGIEFLERIREDFPDLPFILFTGKGSEAVASDAMAAGVTDYLQKETGLDQYTVLANRIDNAVSRSRAERRASQQERKLGLLHDVNRALVNASTREAIADAVATILAGDRRYQAVWLAEYEAETDRVLPMATAGFAGTPSPTAISGEAREESAVAAAVEADELAIEPGPDPVLDDWTEDPDHDATGVLRLRYHGTPVGLLGLHAGVPGTFDAGERDLLQELAGDTAQALHTAATRQILENHQTAIEAVPEGVFVIDGGGHIDLVNDAGASLLDRDVDALEGELFAVLVDQGIFDESVVEWYLEAVPEMLSSDSDREEAWYETELHRSDGESRLVEIHLTLRPYDDEFRGTVGVIRDVSDQRDRKRTLEHQQSVLEAVVETVPQGILVVDDDRNFFTYNAQFVEMWDIPEDVMASGEDDRALQSVLDSLERPEQFMEKVDYFYDNPTERRRDVIQLTDGRRFERFTAPATDDNSDYYGRVWIFQDITERERRQSELERYETLVEEAASGVFAQDAEGRYTFVNSHIEERTGYDREEIIGRRPEMFLPEDDVAAINDGVKQMLFGHRDKLTFETVLTAADGEEIPIEGQLALLPPEDDFTGTVGVVRDISDRLDRERRLEAQNERLDKFAGMISHDLRNPLNVADGRLELVRSQFDTADGDLVEHLDAIEHAHDRMTRLIDDLLELTRGGRTVEEVRPVDLATLVADSWRNVDTEGASLTNRTDATVRGDRGRIQQLLENLFRNAVDHGGEAVTVSVDDLDAGTGFYVADDGPGIPVEDRDQVFESGYSTSAGGTGVGLAVVEEVADAHGWELSLTASEDGGARFEFRDVEPGD